MQNREIYLNDPLENELANNGVAEVKDDQSQESLTTLRYELNTFVCDGAYAAGMDKILSTYIRNVKAKAEQPGVWISGFFGSGKSHLAKMLRTLWTNQKFPDGADALGLAELPENIRKHFGELASLGVANHGLHAASGTLGAGAKDQVRLALLAILFKSVSLPEQYHLARFVMWLKAEGVLEQVQNYIRQHAKGRDGEDVWQKEIRHIHMSPIVADALLSALPHFASDKNEVREMLRAQFKSVTDVSNTEMVDAIMDALAKDGELPLTLVVLDEVQQYIGSDEHKAIDVQEMIETCCKASKFKSRLLFVATGQSALSGMANLNRLMGRFQIPVQLADTDVDAVIRKVILQKKPSAAPTITQVVQDNLGEITRHLRGSKIEHQRDDEQWMTADYPLLPVRRRFWERVLPALDRTGTGSQLRNQLRIVHEATKVSAEQSLGTVVPADFIYEQIANNLLQTGVIAKDIYEQIARLKGGDKDQQLQGRVLSLILLISKLPTDIELGIAATADTLSDLLVENLSEGKHELRAQVPKALAELEAQSLIMSMQTQAGQEYRLQTVESQQWYDMYRQQQSELRANPVRLESLRAQMIQAKIRKLVSSVQIRQGDMVAARDLNSEFGDDLPIDVDKKIYVWAPSTTEKNLTDIARAASPESATIYLYIPGGRKTALHDAIIDKQAAELTLEVRQGMISTEAGKEARDAMEYRLKEATRNQELLLKELMDGLWIKLSGGADAPGNDLPEQLQNAGNIACQRLFPEFGMADNKNWGAVYNRASKEGGENALDALGYQGEIVAHPVCAAIKKFIGLMKTGAEIRENFNQAPYGWPRDTIDGALFAMLAGGVLKAADPQEKAIDARNLERAKVSQTKFRPETVTITKVQLIKVRSLINALGVNCNAGEEPSKLNEALQQAKALARRLGGDAPLPAAPSTTNIDELLVLSGNAQLMAVFDQKDQIQADFEQWQQQADLVKQRQNQWNELQSIITACSELAIHPQLEKESAAIKQNRSLLDNPNPVDALIKKGITAIRDAITAHRERYEHEFNDCLRDLEADANWQKLTTEQQQDILKKRHIDQLPVIPLASNADVMDALDQYPWSSWNDRIAALSSRFDGALKDAISLLQPKASFVILNKTLIESEDQLKSWLDEAERQIREKLSQGPVRIN